MHDWTKATVVFLLQCIRRPKDYSKTPHVNNFAPIPLHRVRAHTMKRREMWRPAVSISATFFYFFVYFRYIRLFKKLEALLSPEKKPVEGKRCCLYPPLMTGSLQYRLDALPVVLVLSMSCRALAFYFRTGLEIEIRGWPVSRWSRVILSATRSKRTVHFQKVYPPLAKDPLLDVPTTQVLRLGKMNC